MGGGESRIRNPPAGGYNPPSLKLPSSPKASKRTSRKGKEGKEEKIVI